MSKKEGRYSACHFAADLDLRGAEGLIDRATLVILDSLLVWLGATACFFCLTRLRRARLNRHGRQRMQNSFASVERIIRTGKTPWDLEPNANRRLLAALPVAWDLRLCLPTDIQPRCLHRWSA